MERTEQKVEITHEQIANWYPMIATPCYDKQVSEPFLSSMIKLVNGFNALNMSFAFSTVTDSLVTRARDNLVAKFMSNPDFTHIMFIDADIGFDYEDIIRMLWHDKDIITGSYPIKKINWSKVIDMAKNNVPERDLIAKSLRYVVNPIIGSKGEVEVHNGALKIHEAGTGFMLIKREVIEKMIEAYPEMKFRDDTGSLNEEEKKWTYHFFADYIDDDGRLLSEDYGFCKYWQKIGGDVWVDASVDMLHLGRMEFEGKMIDFLETIVVSEN